VFIDIFVISASLFLELVFSQHACNSRVSLSFVSRLT